MTERWMLLAALALCACKHEAASSPDAAAGADAALPPGGPGCGLPSAAFCEDVRRPSPGGRAGELDDARWSVSRIAGEFNQEHPIYFPSTPVSACQDGASSVVADHDILFCDAASGHAGQFLVADSAQNYSIVSMRPRQPFDFADRTGTIAFDVDALTEGGLSWWTSVFVTPDPMAGANNSIQVTGEIPRDGIGVNFDDPCYTSDHSKVRISGVFTYASYVETFVPIHDAECVATERGKLNHIEIRLSQTSIEIWASDFSPDGGVTFPNFRKLGAASIALDFTRGYVHYQTAVRAPVKYSSSLGYTNNYWSRLAFDGPVAPVEHAYEAPDALTPNGSGVNLGYMLRSDMPLPVLPLPDVSTAATSAELSFSISFTWGGDATPTNNVVHYRFNGGTWRTPNQPDLVAAMAGQAWGSGPATWAAAYVLPLPDLQDLHDGANQVEISVDNPFNSYPPMLANLELRTR